MSIPGAASPLFLGAAAVEAGPFQIDRSLRFNSADSAYLGRTPSSASNRKTFTFSTWVKRHKFGADQKIFGVNSAWFTFYFTSSDNLRVYYENAGSQYFTTDAVFRDPSAWYHIVLKVDTTQSTASDRVKIYVNSEELTFSATGTTSQNYEFGVNTTNAHDIGMRSSESIMKADFSLAEAIFIDGQALAPTDFGEYDDNNNWNPKAYSGSYGTNGYHLLDFANESTIGNDSSGNNNDWTANNLQSSDGPIYSSGVTAYGGSLNSSHNVTSRLFDGGTGNSNRVVSSSTSGDGIKFVPSTAITGTIQLWLRNGDTANSTISYSLDNGSNFTNLTTTGGDGSYVSIGSQTIGTTNGIIVRHITTAGTNAVDWRAISVDSVMLVDGNFGDVFRDTPTNYEASSGNNGGNYATLNPLQKSSGSTLSNGNLDISMSSAQGTTFATMAFPASGKWYFECTSNATECDIGIAKADASLSQYLGKNSSGYGYYKNGTVYNNDASAGSGASYASGDIIGVAFDADAGTCKWYKNNALQVTVSSLSGEWFPAFGAGSAAGIFNFGARPFAYTPPSNHLPLVTTNLPDPTIADGSTAFDVVTYTGNGGTKTVSGLGFSSDLIWTKQRSTVSPLLITGHSLHDTVRGTDGTYYKELASNTTNAENVLNNALYGGLSSISSTGFTVVAGSDTSYQTFNGNNCTYVAWAWDGGTTTATNTDGSITSNVRANQSAGFSIVTYTAPATATVTIGHGLNAAPEFILVKGRNKTYNWDVYHVDIGPTKRLMLNLSNAAETQSGVWNNTAPTSTVFSSKSNGAWYASGDTLVAYCFTPVAGYSAFGSYTGNGSTDGPFVFTGFRPRWIMFKRSDASSSWRIHDTERETYNPHDSLLFPNESSAETTNSVYNVDIVSNGFKVRNNNSNFNASGGTYLYACFAESPFKYARAR